MSAKGIDGVMVCYCGKVLAKPLCTKCDNPITPSRGIVCERKEGGDGWGHYHPKCAPRELRERWSGLR